MPELQCHNLTARFDLRPFGQCATFDGRLHGCVSHRVGLTPCLYSFANATCKRSEDKCAPEKLKGPRMLPDIAPLPRTRQARCVPMQFMCRELGVQRGENFESLLESKRDRRGSFVGGLLRWRAVEHKLDVPASE